MSSPVLHVVAGPNGAGKTTLVERVLQPETGLPFVNADRIAAQRWPGEEVARAYEASQLAEAERHRRMRERSSFIAETVFSHESKVQLASDASMLGYLVHLHVVLVPVELAVARVADRVGRGGHTVPQEKIRERFTRLWPLVAEAARIADRCTMYDNSRIDPALRIVARFENGRLVGAADWPDWTPPDLVSLR